MKLDSEPKKGDYVSYVESLMKQYALEDAAKTTTRTGFPTAPAPASARTASNRIEAATEAATPTLTRLPGVVQRLFGNVLLFLAALLLIFTILSGIGQPFLPFLIFALFVGGQTLRANAKHVRTVIASSDAD